MNNDTALLVLSVLCWYAIRCPEETLSNENKHKFPRFQCFYEYKYVPDCISCAVTTVETLSDVQQKSNIHIHPISNPMPITTIFALIACEYFSRTIFVEFDFIYLQ
jgi:hypothetical protein